MDFVDVKYINLIASRLQKFKKVKSNLYNLRCCFCGDSKKNKNRARGYFYSVKNNTNYKCHNCGLNISFSNFLKTFDLELHKQYVFDKFKEGHSGKNFPTPKPEFKFETPKFKPKLDLPKASENEKSKQYLEKRKLDPNKFYYAENFKSWVNSIKHTFEDVSKDSSRIVIPLYYQNNLIGIQGRTLGSDKIKYITIMFDENAPKIYGLDEIKKNETVYITEGPFDSTFIPNSIALCGADGNISSLGILRCVWIYDNEPRNEEIIQRISKCIDRGEKVVIWPSYIKEKDINEIILSGRDVMSVIKSNIYTSLEAKLKFNIWKKL